MKAIQVTVGSMTWMLCNISLLHFVERFDRSHFSYTYRMPYDIKRAKAAFLKKKLIWGFCTKMDNRQKMRFYMDFIWIFTWCWSCTKASIKVQNWCNFFFVGSCFNVFRLKESKILFFEVWKMICKIKFSFFRLTLQ